MVEDFPPTDTDDRTYYEPGVSDHSLTEAILVTLEREGIDISGNEFVLFDHVNPDALDDLFREESDAEVRVEFEVAGFHVLLRGDGCVFIDVLRRDRDPYPASGGRG